MAKKRSKGFSNNNHKISGGKTEKISSVEYKNLVNSLSNSFKKKEYQYCLELLLKNDNYISNDPKLIGLRGTCQNLGNIAEAETDLKLSLSLDPSQSDILHNYAGLLRDIGQTEKAQKYALSAISFHQILIT